MADEIDYTEYKDKAPTDLQERFVPWIKDKTGYNPAIAKTKEDAFAAGVRLSVSLRIPFQASPENREATEQRRKEREEEMATVRAQREEEKAAKAREREEEAAARQAAAEEKASAKAAKAAAAPAKATAAPAEPAKAAAAPVKRTGRKTQGRVPAPF